MKLKAGWEQLTCRLDGWNKAMKWVSAFILSAIDLQMLMQWEIDKISPSADLKSTSDGQVLSWVQQTMWIGALSGGILGLIHPQLFIIGHVAMLEMLHQPNNIANMEDTKAVMSAWALPFTGISLVMNCLSPIHRDVHDSHPWMDLLILHGPYCGCCIELWSLGIWLRYKSSTGVAICGKVLPHAVSDCEGEQACLAYYMWDSVHNKLHLPAGQWMNVN